MAAVRRLYHWSFSRAVAASRAYATATPATSGEGIRAPIQVFGIEGRYAHAIFSAASKSKSLEKVESDLNGFQKLVAGRKEIADFLKNPTLTKQHKEAKIVELLKEQKCSDLTVNLFSTLISNNRLSRTSGVIKAFGTIMSAHRGEVLCAVTTAKPLDEKTRKELEKVLQGFLEKGQVLRLDLKIEPSIIGGMVVEIGDKYIDMATATKIKKIVKTLNESLLQ